MVMLFINKVSVLKTYSGLLFKNYNLYPRSSAYLSNLNLINAHRYHYLNA